jgi:hypothetical protein
MTAAWTVQDNSGRLLGQFACGSPQEVGRKIMSGRYDAFRLEVSTSYRELFQRAVAKALKRQGWRIVRVPRAANVPARRPTPTEYEQSL